MFASPPLFHRVMLEVLAPAKVNLSLRILGKRPDGFHDLRSLVCPVSVFDRLRLRLRAGSEAGILFRCSDSTIPSDGTNLVVRAARLFCDRVGIEPALEVDLEKGIPHGAGLGGGSSDAAATLTGLNRLYGSGLSVDALSVMAEELGSDVPLFLRSGAVWITGRGERVEAATLPREWALLMVKPGFGVPTPWAYGALAGAGELSGIDFGGRDIGGVILENDLERPVFGKYLLLAEVKRWLSEQEWCLGALMSGSGSTVFGVFNLEAEADECAGRFGVEFGGEFWVRVARTMGRVGG
ncbi:MAG: 4-(cytidine 5-diphospho)-2-C-methyl-D-erythritol kinase [Verrucomicrobiota bacterium]